jgi:hypothetical protein
MVVIFVQIPDDGAKVSISVQEVTVTIKQAINVDSVLLTAFLIGVP